MDCGEYYKKMGDLRKKIEGVKSDYVGYRYGVKKTDPEEIKSHIAHQYGVNPEALATNMANAEGTQTGNQNLYDASEKLKAGAAAYTKEAQGDPQQFIKDKSGQIRDAINKSIDVAFNVIPKGANKLLKDFLFGHATNKELIPLGENTYTGSTVHQQLRADGDKLWKGLKQNNPELAKSIGKEDMQIGMRAAAHTRGHDFDEYTNGFLKKSADRIESGDQSALGFAKRIDLAQKVWKVPAIREYVQNYWKKLDVGREAGINSGMLRVSYDAKGKEIPAGRESYMHNMVVLKDHQDLYDVMNFGDKLSTSNPTAAKKYSNGLEAEFEGKVIPGSYNFSEEAGAYWKAHGNMIRWSKHSDVIRENAMRHQSDPQKMMVEVSGDKSEPAFVIRAGGKFPGGEFPVSDRGAYKELTNMGPKFEGVYAHPDVYKYYDRVFWRPDPAGVGRMVLKGLNLWRNTVLSGSALFHVGSLLKKAVYANYQTQGLKTAFHLPSMITEGWSHLQSDAKEAGTVLNLIRGGMSLESVDFLKNPALNRKYNEAGQQTIGSTLMESLNKWTDMNHDMMNNVRTGLKVATAVRLTKSDWFQDLVAEKGGDRAEAFKTLAGVMNNTYGGHNYEAMGRSRLVQTIMQSTLMSPNWTESKMKRLFGPVLASDPTARQAYTYALAAEAFAVVTGRILFQQAYGQITGKQRTMKEIAEDTFNRKPASLWLGKSSSGKDMFLDLGGAENQDSFPLETAKAMFNTVKEGDISAVPKEIAHEALNKASPGIKFLADMVGQKRKPTKAEQKEGSLWKLTKGVGSAVRATLPIPAEEALQSGTATERVARGVFGLAGVPITEKNPPEGKKKKSK